MTRPRHAGGQPAVVARRRQDQPAGGDGRRIGARGDAWRCSSATSPPTATPSAWRRWCRRCSSPPAARATWNCRSSSAVSTRCPAATWDFLFIENVGNLVCPSSHDLGEHLRVVVLSTTEGDDKPAKYPKAFRTSQALVISKTDLLPHVPFSIPAAADDARAIQAESCDLAGVRSARHWD